MDVEHSITILIAYLGPLQTSQPNHGGHKTPLFIIRYRSQRRANHAKTSGIGNSPLRCKLPPRPQTRNSRHPALIGPKSRETVALSRCCWNAFNRIPDGRWLRSSDKFTRLIFCTSNVDHETRRNHANGFKWHGDNAFGRSIAKCVEDR
jgi:hypothetical protein